MQYYSFFILIHVCTCVFRSFNFIKNCKLSKCRKMSIFFISIQLLRAVILNVANVAA